MPLGRKHLRRSRDAPNLGLAIQRATSNVGSCHLEVKQLIRWPKCGVGLGPHCCQAVAPSVSATCLAHPCRNCAIEEPWMQKLISTRLDPSNSRNYQGLPRTWHTVLWVTGSVMASSLIWRSWPKSKVFPQMRLIESSNGPLWRSLGRRKWERVRGGWKPRTPRGLRRKVLAIRGRSEAPGGQTSWDAPPDISACCAGARGGRVRPRSLAAPGPKARNTALTIV